MLALVRSPVPRSLMVAMILAAIPTTVSSRAVRAIAAAVRQWREAGSDEDVPRGEAGEDVDVARPDHPLLGVDVPVTDISSVKFERYGLGLARR